MQIKVTSAPPIIIKASGQGPKGEPGEFTFNLIAQTPIGGHRAIALENNYPVYADNTRRAIGISTKAAEAGAILSIQNIGKLDVPGASFTPGALIYVGANGTLTHVEPSTGLSQVLGIAYAPDIILINIQIPILRR